MTTSISNEAVWNYKKYIWTTEDWNGGRENSISMVPLELHPQGGILFLAPARGSNPVEPYPYGVLTLLDSPNLYLT